MADQHGLYIHVPFCSTRCGYCDFNTYTPQELLAGEQGSSVGNTVDGYLDALERELELAAELWERHGRTGVDTVFFGGGTPSMLRHEGLTRALRAVKRTVGLDPHAEVTTESNPETTSPEFFEALRAEGFTRISLGMQSAAGHVLKVLDRKHTPGRPVAAAKEARAAGFEHVNLDLIYGTPTETDADLMQSLEAVLSADVDHVSAYSLIVEDGTAMARKVRKGQLPAPDEDVLADRYAMIDRFLHDAGLGWYEVSNWSKLGGECRHNLLYWRSGQWWGAGPGAHGCVELKGSAELKASAELRDTAQIKSGTSSAIPAGFSGITRLVNAKRPATYWDGLLGKHQASAFAEHPQLTGCVSHVEELTDHDVATERIMLGLRLKEGIPTDVMGQWDAVSGIIDKYVGLGMLWCGDAAGPEGETGPRVGLTDQGKYLADGIVTDIILAMEN